jgi:hypothetical protein
MCFVWRTNHAFQIWNWYTQRLQIYDQNKSVTHVCTYLYMAGTCMRTRLQKVRNMFHVMNRLYVPKMKLINPRIAKLWVKEKWCTDGRGGIKWKTCFNSWTDYTVQIRNWYAQGLQSCGQKNSMMHGRMDIRTDGQMDARAVGFHIVPLFASQRAGNNYDV